MSDMIGIMMKIFSLEIILTKSFFQSWLIYVFSDNFEKHPLKVYLDIIVSFLLHWWRELFSITSCSHCSVIEYIINLSCFLQHQCLGRGSGLILMYFCKSDSPHWRQHFSWAAITALASFSFFWASLLASKVRN